jgi:hypothetical protein
LDITDIPFYINRNANDMCEVFNFLSGQIYDKNKEKVIKEILQQDFKINVNSDEKKNDVRMKMNDFDKSKESAILAMWNDFIETTQFIVTIRYADWNDKFKIDLKVRDKKLFEIMDECHRTIESRKSASECRLYYEVRTALDMSEIKIKYKEISTNYQIDIGKELIVLLETNYPFLKIETNRHGIKILEFIIHDFTDLKNAVRSANVYDANSKILNVSFYLK